MGESGSGKSSLARALLGLERYEGHIYFDNKDLRDLSKDAFVEYCMEWKKIGASIFGGCCGTTPELIKFWKKELMLSNK